MRKNKKGNQRYFGMKATSALMPAPDMSVATAANVHDLDEVARLVRADDEVVVCTDAGHQGAEKPHEIVSDAHLSKTEWRSRP
jgi:IS5 family transposase